jgi:radical SAM protein with 4Fe4S-binding SPASM domain
MEKPRFLKISNRAKHFGKQIINPNFDSFPASVEIHPINYCNNDCPFCWASSGNSKLKKQTLPIKTLKKLIDSLSANGLKSIVLSGGGEPTLYPNFSELVSYIHSKKLKLGIITNGLYNSKDIENSLKLATWIKFSLHASSKDDYMQMTGSENRFGQMGFDRVTRNVKALTSIADENLHISCGFVITSLNENHKSLISFFQYARDELNVDYILFKNYSGPDETLQPKLEQSEISRLMEEIKNENEQSKIFENLKALRNNLNRGRKEFGKECPIVHSGLICLIGSDGGVYPCQPLLQETYRAGAGGEKYCFGYLNKQSFTKIWHGKKRHSFLENLNAGKICPACRYESMYPTINKMRAGKIIKDNAPYDPHWMFLA